MLILVYYIFGLSATSGTNHRDNIKLSKRVRVKSNFDTICVSATLREGLMTH